MALLDEAQVFHAQALAFVQRDGVHIATCALVENGVIRVLNLPNYSVHGPAGFEEVSAKLAEICTFLDHEFWPDDVSLRNPGHIVWPRIFGHSQITDAYLLALAVAHEGCFVTLDHRVAISAVVGATAQHVLFL